MRSHSTGDDYFKATSSHENYLLKLKFMQNSVSNSVRSALTMAILKSFFIF